MSQRGPIIYRADAAAQGGAAPAVWTVGPWEEREFGIVAEALKTSRDWLIFPDIETAIAGLDSLAPPQLLFLAQPRPGMHEQAQVDAFVSAAPLATVVVVAGTWCEGELRTGRPLKGVQRVYWHQVDDWRRRHGEVRSAPGAPHWAGDARLAATGEVNSSDAAGLRDAAVAVDAVDFSVFEALADALRATVRDCVCTPRGRGEMSGATLGIWDGGQLNTTDVAALGEFCRRLPRPGAVIALVDFPRVEHFALITAAGANGLLGKPYRLEALVNELARANTGAKRPFDVGLTTDR